MWWAVGIGGIIVLAISVGVEYHLFSGIGLLAVIAAAVEEYIIKGR